MKFLDKVGLVLFSIIVLIISILLFMIGFNWIEPSIFSVLVSNVLISQTGTYIMIGVSVFLILLSVKCLFFGGATPKTQKSTEGILLQNGDGKLLITKDTLQNVVEGVVKGYNNILDSEVEIKIDKQNNVGIDLMISVYDDIIIKNVTSELQNRIKTTVKNCTDLDVNSVDIGVRQVEHKPEELKNFEMTEKVEDIKEIEEIKEVKPVKETKITKESKPAKGKKKEVVVEKKVSKKGK